MIIEEAFADHRWDERVTAPLINTDHCYYHKIANRKSGNLLSVSHWWHERAVNIETTRHCHQNDQWINKNTHTCTHTHRAKIHFINTFSTVITQVPELHTWAMVVGGFSESWVPETDDKTELTKKPSDWLEPGHCNKSIDKLLSTSWRLYRQHNLWHKGLHVWPTGIGFDDDWCQGDSMLGGPVKNKVCCFVSGLCCLKTCKNKQTKTVGHYQQSCNFFNL